MRYNVGSVLLVQRLITFAKRWLSLTVSVLFPSRSSCIAKGIAAPEWILGIFEVWNFTGMPLLENALAHGLTM